MKYEYTNPEMEVINLEMFDILTVSGGNNNNTETEDDDIYYNPKK